MLTWQKLIYIWVDLLMPSCIIHPCPFFSISRWPMLCSESQLVWRLPWIWATAWSDLCLAKLFPLYLVLKVSQYVLVLSVYSCLVSVNSCMRLKQERGIRNNTGCFFYDPFLTSSCGRNFEDIDLRFFANCRRIILFIWILAL